MHSEAVVLGPSANAEMSQVFSHIYGRRFEAMEPARSCGSKNAPTSSSIDRSIRSTSVTTSTTNCSTAFSNFLFRLFCLLLTVLLEGCGAHERSRKTETFSASSGTTNTSQEKICCF
jgi:hypothetical protein